MYSRLKRFLIIVVITSSIFLCISASASDKPSFRVMTYNIFGVSCLKDNGFIQDSIIYFYGTSCPMDNWYTRNLSARINFIANKIKQMKSLPDVILLQEAYTADSGVMDDKPIRLLAELTGYPYISLGPASRIKQISDFVKISSSGISIDEKGVMSSGLIILSRHPILTMDSISYNACAGVDCKSNIGAQYVRIQLKSLRIPIDIFNTHLQAFIPNEITRIQQINQLKKFVARSVGAGPAVIGGDFNFRFDNQYQSDDIFRSSLPSFTESALACKKKKCKFGKNLSHAVRQARGLDHLFHSDGHVSTTIEPIRVFTKKWNMGGKKVSDHDPVVVDYLVTTH